MENKIKKIINILNLLNIQVAYHHFKHSVSPPYLVIYEDSSDNTFADNKVYFESVTFNIELYTDKKDIALEEDLKNILNENEIPYNKTSEIYISEEKLYEISYEITI